MGSREYDAQIRQLVDEGRETTAIYEHVDNVIEADLDEGYRILRDLECVGIDLHCVTWQLQNEGVQKFIDPYDALMQALATKRQALLGERTSGR